MLDSRILLRGLALAGIFSAHAVLAESPPPAPTHPVLLTIIGAATENEHGQIVLDRPAFEQLPRRSFRTTTIWSTGVITFEGVPVTAILDRYGMTGGTLHLTAVNDYSVDIPVSEIRETEPIIADRMNGNTMSLREKGPLWLVYHYDSDPRFQTEVIFSQSIWQLHHIEVRD